MEEGDPAFWRLLLDRLWPTRTEVEIGAASATAFAWMSAEREAPIVEESPKSAQPSSELRGD